MHYKFEESWKEKQNDVRLVQRKKHLGSRVVEDKKEEAHTAEIEDCSDRATWVNTEELMKNDNPVHSGRNLPSKRTSHITPMEELDINEDYSSNKKSF